MASLVLLFLLVVSTLISANNFEQRGGHLYYHGFPIVASSAACAIVSSEELTPAQLVAATVAQPFPLLAWSYGRLVLLETDAELVASLNCSQGTCT